MAATLVASLAWVFHLDGLSVSVLVCQTPLACLGQEHRKGEHQEIAGRIGESLSFFGLLLALDVCLSGTYFFRMSTISGTVPEGPEQPMACDGVGCDVRLPRKTDSVGCELIRKGLTRH
jgi:hypothetical protein